MELRFLDKTEYKLIEDSKLLWKNCFSDSIDFIDYYYAKRISPDNIVCIVDNKRVLSMACFIPKQLCVHGKILDVCLVAGVATSMEYRNRGFAHAIMSFAEKHINSSALILKPANMSLVKFYTGFGFETLARQKTHLVNIEHIECCSSVSITPLLLLECYTCAMKAYDTFELRSLNDFILLLEEIYIDDAMCIVSDGESYAICEKKEKFFYVTELIGQLTDRILGCIKQHTAADEIYIMTEADISTFATDVIMIKKLDKDIPCFGKTACFMNY